MISQKAVEYLEKKYNVSSFEMDFDTIFKDIDDSFLKRGLRVPHQSIWKLLSILAEMTDDPEVRAHILGWESAADQQADLEAVRQLQESMKL